MVKIGVSGALAPDDVQVIGISIIPMEPQAYPLPFQGRGEGEGWGFRGFSP